MTARCVRVVQNRRFCPPRTSWQGRSLPLSRCIPLGRSRLRRAENRPSQARAGMAHAQASSLHAPYERSGPFDHQSGPSCPDTQTIPWRPTLRGLDVRQPDRGWMATRASAALDLCQGRLRSSSGLPSSQGPSSP
jgi:hypothetical protein